MDPITTTAAPINKRKYNNENRLRNAKMNVKSIEEKRRIIKGYNSQPNAFNQKPEYHQNYYQENKKRIYKRKNAHYHYKKEVNRLLGILCEEQ